MVEENSCFVQRNMRCSNEIEITLNPDEIFKEEVLNFDIDNNNTNNNACINAKTSINFIMVILAFLILREMNI